MAEFTVTAVTLAPIPFARGNVANALMAEVNLLPFCNRVAFCAAGVLELKNFSQFAVIWATAAALDPVLGLLAADEPGADDEAAGALDDDDEDEPEVLELLLQAATIRAKTTASVGARVIRRAKSLNRMTRLLSLGRMYGRNAAILGRTECLLASLHRMFPQLRLITRRWPTYASG